MTHFIYIFLNFSYIACPSLHCLNDWFALYFLSVLHVDYHANCLFTGHTHTPPQSHFNDWNIIYMFD